MKKILAVLALVMLVAAMPSHAAMWDLQKIITGIQMLPDGGLWHPDDAQTSFGTDKDATLEYDTTSGSLMVDGAPFYPSAGFNIGGRALSADYNTSTTNNDMDALVLLDCRSKNVTYVLRPAASAPKQFVRVALQYLPGNFYARINVTNAGTIAGKKYAYTTDDAGVFLPSIDLYSTGGSWLVVGSTGTWLSADA